MPITDISVTDITNFADGHEFGAAGAYVRIKGVARGVLDPAAPPNAGIADLDKAPTNARGFVEYATDFDILRPKDAMRGSGILVYDVPNRGSKRIFNLLDDFVAGDPARTNDPKTREDAGLGFCLGRGYSIVWSGWDPGAPRANGGLGADFPATLDSGRPVTGRIRDEFHFGTRAPGDGSVRRLSYQAASTGQPGARLTVRDRESDRRREIPRGEWEFIDDRSIRLVPEGRKFEPIKIYELWYEAVGAKVLGIGYASVRDLVAFRSRRHCEPAAVGDRRNPPRAGLWRVAERPLPAPFPRIGHERRRRRKACVRRRLQPCRRGGQGLRQSPLWHARAHRDPTRGPALPGKLVPVQHRRDD
jgi:hypothetical protein